MENKKYTVILADDSELKNLSLNGNNFVSDLAIPKTVFEYNLSTVRISDGTNVVEYHDMDLIHLTKMPNGEYWFALRELTEKELADNKVRADVDYLYMMTGVE